MISVCSSNWYIIYYNTHGNILRYYYRIILLYTFIQITSNHAYTYRCVVKKFFSDLYLNVVFPMRLFLFFIFFSRVLQVKIELNKYNIVAYKFYLFKQTDVILPLPVSTIRNAPYNTSMSREYYFFFIILKIFLWPT